MGAAIVDPIAGFHGFDEANVVARINSQLGEFRHGLDVDLSTPKDGQCLFHALKSVALRRLSLNVLVL